MPIKNSIILLIITIVFACGFITGDDNKTPEQYKTYCAGCHGEHREAFIDRRWKYGSDDKAVYVSIKNGIENAGMPAYGVTFTDEEIRSMVSFIKNAQASEKLSTEDWKRSGIYESEAFKIKIDTITDVAEVPWGLAFLPDNTLLLTDRDGDFFHRYLDGRVVKIKNVPEVHAHGQGGLLDVMVHPQASENQTLFLSYSKKVMDGNREKSTTAVVRARLVNDALVDIKEIFEAKPYFETQHHYGSRMVMDEAGYLYISVGERGKENVNPQDLSSGCGKVHRILPDGSVPHDNPFAKISSAVPSIFTYGHRNPQGMAIHPQTKTIWVNEHGPRGGDEINLLKPGANFGWPLTTYGINYNGTTITDKTSAPGITDPLLYWLPSIAPCGAIFVEGDKYGPWKNDYLVPSLRFNYLNRCLTEGDKVKKQEKLLQDIGRMRSIRQDREGYIYIGVEDPGYVLKLIPIW